MEQIILEKISRADDNEISEIIEAIIKRYNQTSPDWEIIFLSLPKNDPEERRKTVDSICDFLRTHNK